MRPPVCPSRSKRGKRLKPTQTLPGSPGAARLGKQPFRTLPDLGGPSGIANAGPAHELRDGVELARSPR
eukprot:5837110-Lingulodinium_polyedra.AAC.1